MGYRYVSDGYARALKVVAVGALALAAWTTAENLDLQKKALLPTCMVNQPHGIEVCSPEPKRMPLFEQNSVPPHDYFPPNE